MSDSTGGGESGGAAGAGQDAEADNEPPQQAPPLPEGLNLEIRETLEEGAPPSAKRPRMSEQEQGLEQVANSDKMLEETPSQAVLLQEDAAPPAQSRVSIDAWIKWYIGKGKKTQLIQVKSLVLKVF